MKAIKSVLVSQTKMVVGFENESPDIYTEQTIGSILVEEAIKEGLISTNKDNLYIIK